MKLVNAIKKALGDLRENAPAKPREEPWEPSEADLADMEVLAFWNRRRFLLIDQTALRLAHLCEDLAERCSVAAAALDAVDDGSDVAYLSFWARSLESGLAREADAVRRPCGRDGSLEDWLCESADGLCDDLGWRRDAIFYEWCEWCEEETSAAANALVDGLITSFETSAQKVAEIHGEASEMLWAMPGGYWPY